MCGILVLFLVCNSNEERRRRNEDDEDNWVWDFWVAVSDWFVNFWPLFFLFTLNKMTTRSAERNLMPVVQFNPLPNKVFPQTRYKSEYWRNLKNGRASAECPSLCDQQPRRPGTQSQSADHVHFMMNVYVIQLWTLSLLLPVSLSFNLWHFLSGSFQTFSTANNFINCTHSLQLMEDTTS